MEKHYSALSAEEVWALRDEHFARLQRLHAEADFLIYAIGLLERNLSGRSPAIKATGARACSACKSGRGFQ